jgi:hypothetical protein
VPVAGFIVPEEFPLPRVPDDVLNKTKLTDFLNDLILVLTDLIAQDQYALNQVLLNKLGDEFRGKLTFNPTTGQIVIPIYAGDPAIPVNGQIWYNSISNTFKCFQGGLFKTFTVA